MRINKFNRRHTDDGRVEKVTMINYLRPLAILKKKTSLESKIILKKFLVFHVGVS